MEIYDILYTKRYDIIYSYVINTIVMANNLVWH